MKGIGKIKVKVDMSKCKNPMECKKCMRVCPEAVFAAIPAKVKKYELSKEFFLFAPFEAACIQCNLCVTACPNDAIRITVFEENEARVDQ